VRTIALLLCLLATVRAAEPVSDPAKAASLLVADSALLDTLSPVEAAALADRLDPLARRLVLGGWNAPGRDVLGVRPYTVVAGDTLSRIATRQRMTVELLQRLNPTVDARRLGIGNRLMVLDAASVPLQIEVNLATHRLLVRRGPTLLLACPVGVGAGGTPTPTGNTTLAARVKNPEWRDPVSGKVYPPGSPRNMLGGFWLGFAAGADGRFRSIGIHGWTGDDPEHWLEKSGSRGCLRLRQSDLTDVYDLVPQGTAISIR
jgi:lipoprotein-anchoring transpeptidase ErfK/SrfK